MQCAIELSGFSGVINRTEFDDIPLDELIQKFREAHKSRDRKTLCITVQVAYPDVRSLGQLFKDTVEDGK